MPPTIKAAFCLQALASNVMFGYIQSMGKIKSAWEIALERTEGIQMDKEKIKYNSDVDKARRTAGRFLSDDDAISREEMESELKQLNPDAVKEALILTAEANLSLPQDENENAERMEKIKALVEIATNGNASAMGLMDELIAFLGQYPKHRKDLFEKMKAQYQPILDEKSQKLSDQYGTEVHLSFENDKEFMAAARQNMERLEGQYQATLTNAKAQLKDIAGVKHS